MEDSKKPAVLNRAARRARHEWRTRVPSVPHRGFDRQITWLLGPPRSGSTWLVRLLARHPQILEVNEPQIGHNLTPFLADTDGFNVEKLTLDNFTNRRLRRDRQNEFFNDEFADIWAPDLGRLIRRRLYAEVRRPSLNRSLRQTEIVIKEPNGSQSADLLLAALPSSRLLFLVRDVRDAVDSELAAVARGSWVSTVFPGMDGIDADGRIIYARKAAHRWAMRVEMVSEAMTQHEGPSLMVRYEDLRPNPLHTLRKILDWMNLDSSEDDLRRWSEELSFERIAPAATGSKSIRRAAKPGGWRENLTEDEVDAIMRVAGQVMAATGYAV